MKTDKHKYHGVFTDLIMFEVGTVQAISCILPLLLMDNGGSLQIKESSGHDCKDMPMILKIDLMATE